MTTVTNNIGSFIKQEMSNKTLTHDVSTAVKRLILRLIPPLQILSKLLSTLKASSRYVRVVRILKFEWHK